jgi:hypothetical protein
MLKSSMVEGLVKLVKVRGFSTNTARLRVRPVRFRYQLQENILTFFA